MALRRPMSRTDDLFPPRRYSLNYLNGSIDLPGPAYLAKAPFHAASSKPGKGANDDVTVQHAYGLTSAELISPRFLKGHNPALSAFEAIDTEYSAAWSRLATANLIISMLDYVWSLGVFHGPIGNVGGLRREWWASVIALSLTA